MSRWNWATRRISADAPERVVLGGRNPSHPVLSARYAPLARATVHDIGTQDGINFLVMEHLDGETLAQRLEKGALPLDQALQVAIEIADA